MNRKILITSIALVVAFVAVAAAADPAIIGAAKCKMCHRAKTGDQFAIWEGSVHAKAFETLKSDEAIAVAKEMGLGDPCEEEACLKCHTTQHFLGAPLDEKSKYDLAEGVSCEACHGAASEYRTLHKKDVEAALAVGLVKGDEETCVQCHNEESPTFQGFDYATMWEKIKHPVPESE